MLLSIPSSRVGQPTCEIDAGRHFLQLIVQVDFGGAFNPGLGIIPTSFFAMTPSLYPSSSKKSIFSCMQQQWYSTLKYQERPASVKAKVVVPRKDSTSVPLRDIRQRFRNSCRERYFQSRQGSSVHERNETNSIDSIGSSPPRSVPIQIPSFDKASSFAFCDHSHEDYDSDYLMSSPNIITPFKRKGRPQLAEPSIGCSSSKAIQRHGIDARFQSILQLYSSRTGARQGRSSVRGYPAVEAWQWNPLLLESNRMQ